MKYLFLIFLDEKQYDAIRVAAKIPSARMYLDLVPKDRDEASLPYLSAW